MSLAVAHVLEWPGKRRLDRETYLAAQTIYYPGFTFGGFREVIGTALPLVLVFLLFPYDGSRFVWMAVAFVSLVAMHVVFWTVTQRENTFWLIDTRVSKIAAAFFRLKRSDSNPPWRPIRTC